MENFEAENDQITVVMHGLKDYEAEIETEGRTVRDMYCSCLYVGFGEYCKHKQKWKGLGKPNY